MNPTNLIPLAIPGFLAWCLADDFQKARIRHGLCNSPDLDPDSPPITRIEAPPPGVTDPVTPIPRQVETHHPQPKSLEYRKTKLIQALEEHNARVIWELRNTTPLRFTGWQRSGKTTKAQALALLRQIDDLTHPVMVATPHRPTPGDTPWPSSFAVVGEGNQWDDIKAVIDGLMQRLAKGDTNPITTILDEFSGYCGQGAITDGYIQEVMLSAIREMAKHSQMLVLIAHGNTSALNGNIKGLNAALWGNFVTVECTRRLIDGKPSPGPQVSISGGGYPETAIDWPEWLHPTWLLQNFPELSAIQAAPPKGPSAPNFGLGAADLWDATELDLPAPSSGLEPHLAAIVEYIDRKGSVSPRQIQQAKLKALGDCGITKADQIQLCLDCLLYSGHLTLNPDGTYALLGVGQSPD